MNNEAFRELVNQRNKPLSSKEIAQAAVEEEFKEKKHKEGFDGDLNLSDDDIGGNNDNDEDKAGGRERYGKFKKKKKSKEDDGDNGTLSNNRYRDRAKERRDGKNLDYQMVDGIQMDGKASSEYNEDMTKFLGGDEQFTHLVKGLDKTLAEKVRREEMTTTNIKENQEIDLDEVIREATSKAERRSLTSQLNLSNIEGSALFPFASSMLSYIKRVEERKMKNTCMPVSDQQIGHKSFGAAGQTIHRSKFDFSLRANIKDRLYAWELPKESIMSKEEYASILRRRRIDDDDKVFYSCTPLDTNLILKIKSAIADYKKNSRHHERHTRKRSASNSTTSKVKKKKKSEIDQHGIQACSKESTNIDTDHHTHTHTQQPDSDDDIFGDIGEYIPPTARNVSEKK